MHDSKAPLGMRCDEPVRPKLVAFFQAGLAGTWQMAKPLMLERGQLVFTNGEWDVGGGLYLHIREVWERWKVQQIEPEVDLRVNMYEAGSRKVLG
jgi:hypothetical protein